ncbi:MAG: DUF3516 domain-containing protein [Myxococcaceae bacterium]|nr:DUF3516 domain-containing protein [Myxococcaceae bacterium]
MTAPLAALLPAPGQTLQTDEILNRFVGWVASTGLSLYPAQEEAVLELFGGNHLVLGTPTGSGKSLVATALHFKAMCEGKTSFYTCPIKALVNEKFFALCEAFGPDNVGMLTGDASINRDAKIVCCTAEILSNYTLRELAAKIDYVIMDEFHYYADRERGVAWQVPLLTLKDTTFLLMSATLGDTTAIEANIEELTGRRVAKVKSGQRPVPLDFAYAETPLHETIEALVTGNKAPVYLVNFTQRAAAEQAQNLMSVNFCTKEEKEAIRVALHGVRFDTPFGKEMEKFLKHGIGLHHAGLLPRYRLLVEKLAQAGHLKVISGTDTLGVGVNIPIRTVLFTQLCKFDGEKVGILSVRDFLQIAGRAGRKGFDEAGSVVVQAPEHVIENLRLEAKAAAGKKVVKRQPPQKGYAHWDRSTFERLVNGTPEPLQSRFEVTFGMLLNLLQSDPFEMGDGYRRLVELVKRSHERDYVKRQNLKLGAQYFRTLRQAGIVEVFRKGAPEGVRVRVAPDLQREFSLHHTLSLYLVETLGRLDPTSPTYALDVVTLVESILENPDVVLYAQLNKLKGEKLAELKAQGMEYEDRMAELEKLEWPKPNRDFIYGTFNDFEARHPWVGHENIRPKSIARDMLERFTTFNDYVRELGLQRSEGVLLRYLSEVYKTLVQTVPETLRTDEVEDIIQQLRVMLRAVDSSLLDEWERMRHPEQLRVVAPEEVRLGGPATFDPKKDLKRFTARVRAELHRLLKAVGTKDWEEAALSVFNLPGEEAWSPERIAKEAEPYFATHAGVDLTPRARLAEHTLVREENARRWSAQQKILDPEGEADWVIDCVVDLTCDRPPDAPLISLRRIGT